MGTGLSVVAFCGVGVVDVEIVIVVFGLILVVELKVVVVPATVVDVETTTSPTSVICVVVGKFFDDFETSILTNAAQ